MGLGKRVRGSLAGANRRGLLLCESLEAAALRTFLTLDAVWRHAIYFAREGFNVRAFDLSQEAVDYLTKWAAEEKPANAGGKS